MANRSYFYEFITDEFMDVPAVVKEPALTFLGTGAEKMEKWIFWWARVLQRRIKTNPKEIEFIDGMLFVLRLIWANTQSTIPRQASIMIGAPETEKKDAIKELDSALAGLREKNLAKPPEETK